MCKITSNMNVTFLFLVKPYEFKYDLMFYDFVIPLDLTK